MGVVNHPMSSEPVDRDVIRTPVTDYTMFYEVAGGALVRRMQPVEVAHRWLGSGPVALVALHSLSGAGETFRALAAELEGRARVLAVDLRGFGASHRPTAGYDVEALAADVGKVVAEARPGLPWILLGHGLGAAVALAAAPALAPDGLVLSGVAAVEGAPDALTDLMELATSSPDRVGAELERLTGTRTRTADVTPQVLGHLARAWCAFDGASARDDLTMPVLVLTATEDHLTPAGGPGGAEWLAASAAVELVELAGPHELPNHAADAVAEALGRWLDNTIDPEGEGGT